MLILISPAKSLNYDVEIPNIEYSQPTFLKKSQELITELKKLKPNDIAKLMKLSDKLATLNYDRYHQFKAPFDKNNAKPALFVFNGDVYSKIDVQNYNETQLNYAQNHLRILSGLYGMLKPLDLMQPYRLEMSTKLKNPRGGNLYQFWGDELSKNLDQEGQGTIINLASEEYFSAIDQKTLKTNHINIIFKEKKPQGYKIISVHAKKARGMMVDYLIKNAINNIEDIKKFDQEGYKYNKTLSDAQNFTFCRESQN